MSTGEITAGPVAGKVSDQLRAEPYGPKPRHVSAGRIGLYAFLAVSALFFLIPLYVMIVTSLKGTPNIYTA